MERRGQSAMTMQCPPAHLRVATFELLTALEQTSDRASRYELVRLARHLARLYQLASAVRGADLAASESERRALHDLATAPPDTTFALAKANPGTEVTTQIRNSRRSGSSRVSGRTALL